MANPHPHNQALLNVGIIEPHALLREGLCALTDSTPGMRCVGAWEESEAAHVVPADDPAVLLFSVSARTLPPLNNLQSAKRGTVIMLHCQDPDCPLNESDRTLSRPAESGDQHSGCRALAGLPEKLPVIRSNVSFSALREAIWEAAAVDEPGRAAQENGRAGLLSRREREVADLIARGRSNREIAKEMTLSYSAVKNYVSSILSKLELKHRTQIALYMVGRCGSSTYFLLDLAAAYLLL